MLINRTVGYGSGLVLPDLDCAVIETLHEFREEHEMKAFDSVRGVFSE